MAAEDKTVIRTSLPFCLYRVDSRFFKLGDAFNSKIKFTKVETTPNRRTQSSQNIEVIRDRWGIDAHSDVEIYTEKHFADVAEAEKFSLKIINNFIQRYRYFDREAIHLVPLSREDLFNLSSFLGDKGTATISLAGGITVVNPHLVREISNDIEKSLTENKQIPFYEELLLNSEQYIYQIGYRHSILESVIALELVISDFIHRKCEEKNIPKTDAEEYIKNIGITGNIKVTLKLLLDNSLLPQDILLDACKSGITIRNSIVHKGRKEVTVEEAQNTLDSSRELISFLLPLIQRDE